MWANTQQRIPVKHRPGIRQTNKVWDARTEVEKRPVAANRSCIELHMRSQKTIFTPGFSSTEDAVEDSEHEADSKTFILQRPDSPPRRCFPLLIDRFRPIVGRRVIHPIVYLTLRTCRDCSPPCSFLSLNPFLFSFFTFPCPAPSHEKSNYNTAKPIQEQQTSHSVVEGGWNACCHETSKLQRVRPRLIARPVQHWDQSTAMWVDPIV